MQLELGLNGYDFHMSVLVKLLRNSYGYEGTLTTFENKDQGEFSLVFTMWNTNRVLDWILKYI